jgi:ribonuclease D
MSPESLRPPILVETPVEFQKMLSRLAENSRIAVDTESNSLHAYQERVCLIQLSTPSDDYLLDPLQLRSLEPIAEIFNSPKVQKVLHGAEYDLLCLWRDFGFRVKNLFDTRVAVRTLGWQKTGLGDILAKEFGVRLNKRFQRADWGKRPLPEELLNYARLDTHYLLDLHERLETELIEAGRLQEASEICELFTDSALQVDNSTDQAGGFWRISQVNKLKPRQVAVLRELYHFRETQAEQRDCPPFRILKDEVLIHIAVHQPEVESELVEISGLPKHKRSQYGKQLLQAVQRGKSATVPRKRRSAPHDRSVTARFHALKRWRREEGLRRNVESDLILPRTMLWEIAQDPPEDMESLRKHMGPLTWRLEQYGLKILELLNT